MNSEITNVLRFVSTTVVSSNRQNEEPASLTSDAAIGNKIASGSVLTAGGVKEKEEGREFGSNINALDKLKSAAVAGNSMFQAANRNLEFKVDELTKKVVVKIVDNDTGKTVIQIPSEDMLAFIKNMQQLDGEKGSVIQHKA